MCIPSRSLCWLRLPGTRRSRLAEGAWPRRLRPATWVGCYRPPTTTTVQSRMTRRAPQRAVIDAVPMPTAREDAPLRDLCGAIDNHIVSGRIFPTLMIMRDQFGDSIHEALDSFAERYEYLREVRPDDFTKSREEYGRGFTPRRSPGRGRAGLQFGLQFTAVSGRSRKTGDGCWSKRDGRERWSPELLMRFGKRHRGRPSSTPYDRRASAGPGFLARPGQRGGRGLAPLRDICGMAPMANRLSHGFCASWKGHEPFDRRSTSNPTVAGSNPAGRATKTSSNTA
ncbi:hypothetical protein SAMN05421874_15616 [Nonomuraea maritima]|uniref:Uncharacterized protein n=1 Tax=Nonomuraea maritima TaxID=683260 RepID=A0A1G9SEM3_9ACTN|nr:hypothetical protein SAMN05421874_15616 [Nonomuraea maritima]